MPHKKSVPAASPFGQFVEKVKSFLDQSSEEVYSLDDLQRFLRLREKKHRSALETALQQLIKANAVKQIGREQYQSTFTPQVRIGKLEVANPRFGFLVSETGEPDIKILAENWGPALDGDQVKAMVLPPDKKSHESTGEILEVIVSKRTHFVGKIQIQRKVGFIVADHRKIYVDFVVQPEDQMGALDGQKVLIEHTGWEHDGKHPTAKVTKVLGNSGEHETEMHAIMAEFGLPTDFPEHILDAARKIPQEITQQDIQERRDFRSILTFTIDPFDAKDFDDAISFEFLPNGHYEIGVHIADVTHYVQLNTTLEEEAFKRATSVYLVDRCIPMLPEILSNELCSLRPKEDKLTFSAVFELDEHANLIKEWFGRTIIHSDRRFSYEEAQEILEQGEGDHFQELTLLNTLAKKLKLQRFHKGAINFETVEVKFTLDEKGKPTGLKQKIRKDAHKLVEDFMLLANKRVAEFVYQYQQGKDKNVMVYRTHDRPDPEKLRTFSNIAERFGHKIDPDSHKIANDLNKLMAEVEGKPEQNIIEGMAIRSMAKAKYTTAAHGHFGLAFEHYSHFTSPIRRYPDMMAHRLLQQYLSHKVQAQKAEFELKCKHSSEMEKRAADAERASIKYKQVEFISQMIGQQFDGIVSGITEWGIFVELNEARCEGLLRFQDLKDDYYDVDLQHYRVVGRRNGNVIQFGDAIKVKVKATDLDKRTIDLQWIAKEA